MMKFFASCFWLLMAWQVVAADAHQVLSQLSADLTAARALPEGTETSYACPPELDLLNGVRIADVLAALPKPDYEGYEGEGSVTYSLRSPALRGQKGGGNPDITFIPDKSGKIERITCFLSR